MSDPIQTKVHVPVPDEGCGGLAFFPNNRANKSVEELSPFSGMCVAWSADASRVLAAGPDWESVFAQLQTLGVDRRFVVHEYIE